MSTPTILDLLSISSGPSLTCSLSPLMRHKNCAPRSISDPTLPTRTNLQLPSPKKSWFKCETSSQTLRQYQCPHMHYLPYCDMCWTLMGWEPPPPIKPTPKHSTMSFGKLKEYCRCLPTWREYQRQQTKKTCTKWREEQFE